MRIYFAVFDEDGRPKGFYTPEINGNKIPAEAIEISEAEWQDLVSNQGSRRWDGEKVVECEPQQLETFDWERVDEFYLWLGRFASQYAEVEAHLFFSFLIDAELSVDVGMALFPESVSFEVILQRWAEVRRARNIRLLPSTERALAQFAKIKTARNILLHTAPRWDASAMATFPKLRKSPKTPPKAFSASDLEAMCADLSTVSAAIALQSLDGIAPEPFLDQGFRPAAKAEWRYNSK